MNKKRRLIILSLIMLSVCLPVRAETVKLKFNTLNYEYVTEFVFFKEDSKDGYKIEFSNSSIASKIKIAKVEIKNNTESGCFRWNETEKRVIVERDKLIKNNGMCKADITLFLKQINPYTYEEEEIKKNYKYNIMAFGNENVLSNSSNSTIKIVKEYNENEEIKYANFKNVIQTNPNLFVKLDVSPSLYNSSSRLIYVDFTSGSSCLEISHFYNYLRYAFNNNLKVITSKTYQEKANLIIVYDLFRKEQNNYPIMFKVNSNSTEFKNNKTCLVEMSIGLKDSNSNLGSIKKFKFKILLPSAQLGGSETIPESDENPDGNISCEGIFSRDLIDFFVDILGYVKVFVPILIVLLGSIDLLRNVFAGNDDEIKKGWNRLVKRIVFGALIYVLIYFVSILFPFANEALGGCLSEFK